MAVEMQRTGGSYVEIAPVVTGAILACAITAVLLQFGGALGLTAQEVTYYEGEHYLWRVVIVGVWLFVVQLLSSLAGGYIGGRMRMPLTGAVPHEIEMRDSIHGLLVWATATVLMVAGVAFGTLISAVAEQGMNGPDTMMITEDMARKTGIILGFSVAASALVSALAAMWAGMLGGHHRDHGTDLSRFISLRRHR